jgi:hypothetical protein
MWQDPIVEETREARELLVEACGEDVHTFFEFLRAREAKRPHEVVTLAPNTPEPEAPLLATR